MKLVRILYAVFILSMSIFSQAWEPPNVVDPLPYEPIALDTFSDTTDQLVRDSATIQIGRVRVNQAGYRPEDVKKFYYVGNSSPGEFSVIEVSSGETVATGSMKSTGYSCSGQFEIRASNNATRVPGGDTRYEMTGPEVSGDVYQGVIPDNVPVGEYRIEIDGETSGEFVINEEVYGWVKDAALKFFGINRCGDTDSWFHPPCHLQDATQGGWHDCGDHLKEGITQSYTAYILGLTAAAFSDRDDDRYGANHLNTVHTDGIPDILYEAKHGCDYVINAYNNAGGDIGSMILSVGAFQKDHNWWGSPEYQDEMSTERGGPPREARNETGANNTARFSAAMAYVSKMYQPYDAEYAAKCLSIAEELYEYAKANRDPSSSDAYVGETSVLDDIAGAAVALAWATEDSKYLDDLCYKNPVVPGTEIGDGANTYFEKFSFEGGLFAGTQPQFSSDNANTCWASVQVPALWSFYRLILKNEQLCNKLLTDLDMSNVEEERKVLLEHTAYQLVYNISRLAEGDASITLPDHGYTGASNNVVQYGSLWKTMKTQEEWVWNRYQFGNITEMYMYSDIAMYLQGRELPNTPASTEWKGDEVRQLTVDAVNYMLGMNPWDVSMIYGVGNKNFNHPHHRAANPEGKNVPGAFYKYFPPVGALQGGYDPTGTSVYDEHYDEYRHSEVGIDATSNMMIPLTGLAKSVEYEDPDAEVEILYVGYDNAIIEITQSRYGTSTINYGIDPAQSGSVKASDSSGVNHTIELTGLQNGTTYNFTVSVEDINGNTSEVTMSDGSPYSFTTSQFEQGDAEITNVKVCKVSSDSAEILWYTPNGEYDSKVVYGKETPLSEATSNVETRDVAGHPVKVHYVKIGGLEEKTDYYFYVESGNTIDDNNGQYYTFTTPVEWVDFDIRTIRYEWGGKPVIGINFVNQDVKEYDSLELRFYMRGTEEEMEDLGARVDIGIKYNSAGFQDSAFKQGVDDLLQDQKPVKIEDTYDPSDGSYGWYFRIPMGDAVMESGARFRLDVLLVKRNLPFNDDLLDEAPTHIPDDGDWSFREHRRADGDPVDYGGVPEAPKDDLDENFWNHEVNQYVTVYRKNEFVWGYSPSKSEMEEKKTNYEMKSQVTDPLMNPSEDHAELERAAPVIEVKGWAEVTSNGVINDIWANGERIEDLSNVVAYNFEEDRFDYNIDVPMSNGGNVVDITIFGGPSADCEGCYGCTFSNHHFYVEFSGAEQYPATMTLWEDGSPISSDTVQADSSSFSVILQDKNGDRDTAGVDTLHAGVKVRGRDSLTMTLVETGVSSGTFRSAGTVSLVSGVTDPSENRLFIQGGDQVIVRYEDPTDPTDVVVQNLYAKADFPVPIDGFIKDTDGDGRADRVAVDYSKILESGVDSLMVPFPSDMESFKFMSSAMNTSGYRLTVSDNTVFPEYTTSFAEGNSGEGMSWLDPGSGTKESPVTIYDSIGPVLTQGILVETGYSDRDSMVISLSEDIRLTDLESESLILISGGTEFPLEVLNAESVDNGMISVIVRGSVRPSPGDSIKLASDGSITDMFNNTPHPDNRPVGLSFIAGPIPVSSGRYYDSNADGVVDSLYLKFAKRVPVDSLRNLNLKWQSSEYTIGIESIENPSDSVLAVDLSGIVKETATSGEMSVNAEYEELGASEYHIINDRAAPVILGAVYIPGQGEDGSSESTGDSLRVVFSEGIKSDSISFPEPFNTVKRQDSSPFSIQFEPSGAVVKGAEATFSVSSVDPMPEEGDLINISVSGGISDGLGNSQRNPDNRQEEIIVKPIEPEFSILAHNPPGGEHGVLPKMLMDSTAKVNSGAVVQINSGTNIRDDNDKVEFRISVEVYDVVGNYITGCSNQDVSDCDHIEFVTVYSGGRKDFIVWSLKNRNNRFVGQGNYSVHVKVESVVQDNVSSEIKKEFDNIAKFAEEDCIINVRN